MTCASEPDRRSITSSKEARPESTSVMPSVGDTPSSGARPTPSRLQSSRMTCCFWRAELPRQLDCRRARAGAGGLARHQRAKAGPALRLGDEMAGDRRHGARRGHGRHGGRCGLGKPTPARAAGRGRLPRHAEQLARDHERQPQQHGCRHGQQRDHAHLRPGLLARGPGARDDLHLDRHGAARRWSCARPPAASAAARTRRAWTWRGSRARAPSRRRRRS